MRTINVTAGTKRNALAEARRQLGLTKATGAVTCENEQEPGLSRFTLKSGDVVEYGWAKHSPVIINGIY